MVSFVNRNGGAERRLLGAGQGRPSWKVREMGDKIHPVSFGPDKKSIFKIWLNLNCDVCTTLAAAEGRYVARIHVERLSRADRREAPRRYSFFSEISFAATAQR